MLEDDVFVGTIHDNPDSLLRLQISGNRVIDDPCPLVEKHRQVAFSNPGLAFTLSAANSSPLQQLHTIRASDDELSHVTDIEDGGGGPAVEVLLDDPLTVIDRQVVS